MTNLREASTRSRRFGGVAAALGAAAICGSMIVPHPALAWWGPAYAGPPRVYYAPPPAYYYAAPPRAHFVPGHYNWRGFWVPGHWVA
jgi:hypothetical protein